MITKICTGCQKELPLESFSKQKKGKYSHKAECRNCSAIRAKNDAKRYLLNGPSMLRFEKYCPACKQVKNVADFPKVRTTYDGLASECHECALRKSKLLREKRKTFGPTIHREIKTCPRCEKEKGISEFFANNSAPDGHSVYCKECDSKRYESLRQRRKKNGPTIFRTEKFCPACKSVKSTTKFSKSKNSSDGLQGICKRCQHAILVNRAQKGKYIQRDYKLCPDCQETKPAIEFTKHKGMVDGLSVYCRQCDNTKKSHWQKNNREKVNAKTHRYWARKLNAEGNYTVEQWKIVRDYYAHNGICPACKEARGLCADHIIPLSKGGSNLITNIQPLCIPCNSSKRDKTIDYRFDKGELAQSLISTT